VRPHRQSPRAENAPFAAPRRPGPVRRDRNGAAHRVPFNLNRGDALVMNNYNVLHARTRFTVHPEPGRTKRLKGSQGSYMLLRLTDKPPTVLHYRRVRIRGSQNEMFLIGHIELLYEIRKTAINADNLRGFLECVYPVER
jgi:hypothetical protein